MLIVRLLNERVANTASPRVVIIIRTHDYKIYNARAEILRVITPYGTRDSDP